MSVDSKVLITKRRARMPQNRTWNQVVEMLLSIIDKRPVNLICKGCYGEHMVCSAKLELHCTCGVVTRYQPFGLFHHWTWLTTLCMMQARRYNVQGDTNPLRDTWIASARIVDDVPLTSPQQPLDTRVQLWRLRGAA